VVDNYREQILDGVIFETPERELRFVDGPEVQRTAQRGVTLSISAAEAAGLGPGRRRTLGSSSTHPEVASRGCSAAAGAKH